MNVHFVQALILHDDEDCVFSWRLPSNPELSLPLTESRMTDNAHLGIYSHKLHPARQEEKMPASVGRSVEGSEVLR